MSKEPSEYMDPHVHIHHSFSRSHPSEEHRTRNRNKIGLIPLKLTCRIDSSSPGVVISLQMLGSSSKCMHSVVEHETKTVRVCHGPWLSDNRRCSQ